MKRFVATILCLCIFLPVLSCSGCFFHAAAETLSVFIDETIWDYERGGLELHFYGEDRFRVTGDRYETLYGDYYIDGDTVALVFGRYTRDMKRITGILQGEQIYFKDIGGGATFILRGPESVLKDMQLAFKSLDIGALIEIFHKDNPKYDELHSLMEVIDFFDFATGVLDIFDMIEDFDAADFIVNNVLASVVDNASFFPSWIQPNLMYVIHSTELNGDTARLIVSFYVSAMASVDGRALNDDELFHFDNPVLIEAVCRDGKWLIWDAAPATEVSLSVDSMIGKWSLSSIIAGCSEFEAEYINSIADDNGIYLNVQIHEDGTYNLRFSLDGELLIESGTWGNKAGTLTLGEGISCFMAGDELVILAAGIGLKCSRVTSTQYYMCGGYLYSINDQNEAMIMGSKKTADNKMTIKIPSILAVYPVTRIWSRAFAGREDLVEVHIEEGVKEIGRYGFSGCTALTSVVLPRSLETIGEGAFSNCSSLESITLPENLSSIGGDAFYGCSKLRTISIPESVTYIHEHAFYEHHTPLLVVPRDSYAEQYCKDNGIFYEYPVSELDWLQ